MEQRSEEWFQARLGKVTASNIDNVVVKVKNGESTYKRKYRIQLITELLTNKNVSVFVNDAMRWGIEHEDEARDLYIDKKELLKGVDVTEIGFIGLNGLIEIKCPTPTTHTEILMTRKIPSKWVHQMQWQMACMPEREWCDFVCYHPHFHGEQKMLIVRVERDDDLITRLEKDVQDFVTEVQDSVKFIKESN
jgi:predicted phage-related endonuclease